MAERTRLTSKTAAELTAATNAPNQPNDVYVNDSRTIGNKNVPEANGTPESWAEGVQPAADLNKKHDVETNRNEMGLVDAKAAIKNASELESKAVKCLVASQRMLPGAGREVLEANAFDMMYLPTASIDGILSRQEGLARSIAASATKIAEECKEEKVEEKEAAFVPFEKKEEKVEEKEATVDPEMAKMAAQISALTALVTKLATEKAEAPVAPAAEVAPEAVKTASTADALTDIFAAVSPASNKAGAASMQGLVRTASSREEDLLSALWSEEA